MEEGIKVKLAVGSTANKEEMQKFIDKFFEATDGINVSMSDMLNKLREEMTPEKAKRIEEKLNRIKDSVCERIDKIIEGNNNLIEQKEKEDVEVKRITKQGCAVVLEAEDMMKLFNGEEVLIEFGELREIGSVRISSQK